MKNIRWKVFFCCIFLTILFFGIAEVTLRKRVFKTKGMRVTTNTKIEPGGRLLAEDPVFGYASLPGRFEIKTIL